ncbi:MAG: hypothetical protein LBL39_06410, partial [Planctomycetaceae bacterium]|nr:hypothetical protein [Planctomycetaceae bacterium]
MENSNNDRWSLLATDLGIETNEVKSSEVEKETVVVDDVVVKDAVVAVTGNSTAEHSEQPQFTTPAQITPITTPTNTKESGHQENLEQKNKFNVSAPTRSPYNSSGNSTKSVAAPIMKQTKRSNFGAGILEPVESDHENNFAKDTNDAAN